MSIQHKLRNKAFAIFDQLLISQSIVIRDFAKNDPEAFTQYAKDYIDRGGGLQFSNDYSVITKIQSYRELMDFLESRRLEKL